MKPRVSSTIVRSIYSNNKGRARTYVHENTSSDEARGNQRSCFLFCFHHATYSRVTNTLVPVYDTMLHQAANLNLLFLNTAPCTVGMRRCFFPRVYTCHSVPPDEYAVRGTLFSAFFRKSRNASVNKCLLNNLHYVGLARYSHILLPSSPWVRYARDTRAVLVRKRYSRVPGTYAAVSVLYL